MRDSFIFYKSFYDAIEILGEKAQLKLYKSIMKLNFNCCENVTELEQLCDEIETSLKQNRNVFAQFLLIKPQILANFSRYLNGSKGKSHGALGGAPKGNKNASKNNPKTTPNIFNENVFNVFNENENGVGVVEEKPNFTNPDFYISSEAKQALNSYQGNCPNLIPLTGEKRNKRIMDKLYNVLKELDNDLIRFKELCIAANQIVKIAETKIDFEMMLNCYIGILNGKYPTNSDQSDDTQARGNSVLEELKRKRGLDSG